MDSRLLVSGAGSGVGNNVLRSLRIERHHDRFVPRKPTADRNCLVHESTH